LNYSKGQNDNPYQLRPIETNNQLRELSQIMDLTNNTVNPIPRVLQPNIPYQRNTTTLPSPDAVNNEAAYEYIVIQYICDTIMNRVGKPSAYLSGSGNKGGLLPTLSVLVHSPR